MSQSPDVISILLSFCSLQCSMVSGSMQRESTKWSPSGQKELLLHTPRAQPERDSLALFTSQGIFIWDDEFPILSQFLLQLQATQTISPNIVNHTDPPVPQLHSLTDFSWFTDYAGRARMCQAFCAKIWTSLKEVTALCSLGHHALPPGWSWVRLIFPVLPSFKILML